MSLVAPVVSSRIRPTLRQTQRRTHGSESWSPTRDGGPGRCVTDLTMTIEDTAPDGECVSDESYPQYCLNCSSEWTLLGGLSRDSKECPECGIEAFSVAFYRWWVIENLETDAHVTVDVAPEVSRAVDELCRVTGRSRGDELHDLLAFEPEYVEDERDGGVSR